MKTIRSFGVIILGLLIGAAAIWLLFRSPGDMKGKVFIVTYQSHAGIPCNIEEGVSLEFVSENKAYLRFADSTYTLKVKDNTDGNIRFLVTYEEHKGGIKTHTEVPLYATLQGDVLLFTSNSLIGYRNLSNYVFVEQTKYAAEKDKPHIADPSDLDGELIGSWSDFDSYTFNSDGTGLWVEPMISADGMPFTWTAKDGILSISFTPYTSPQIVKRYDFVEGANGYFLRTYDINQDPSNEPFLCEYFKKIS